MIELEQSVTVAYTARFTREQAIDLLIEAGADKDGWDNTSDSDIAVMVAATANDDGPQSSHRLYEKLVDAAIAQDYLDTTNWVGFVR